MFVVFTHVQAAFFGTKAMQLAWRQQNLLAAYSCALRGCMNALDEAQAAEGVRTYSEQWAWSVDILQDDGHAPAEEFDPLNKVHCVLHHATNHHQCRGSKLAIRACGTRRQQQILINMRTLAT